MLDCLVSSHTNAAGTLCPAALSENLFHYNPQDVAFLESAEGKRAIVALHVDWIIQYVLEHS